MKMPMRARRDALTVLHRVLNRHLGKREARIVAEECADALLMAGALNEQYLRLLRQNLAAAN